MSLRDRFSNEPVRYELTNEALELIRTNLHPINDQDDVNAVLAESINALVGHNWFRSDTDYRLLRRWVDTLQAVVNSGNRLERVGPDANLFRLEGSDDYGFRLSENRIEEI